ncbi:hypothetical protein BSL78_07880 [Apostichopus japonicus]|uniref:Uncharacterized protein n=1 Tax=Stichopus japonicus TaxID=307972 RepID=A0A2G8L4T5_STIJA|nr:hypothetical protein BSL78_07880 [Apostichopus japonicus]
MDWNGRLVGVQNLRVAPGREVLIGDSAHTALIIDKEYEYIDHPGEFRFVHMEFGALTDVAFPPHLDMKWSSHFTAEYFNILSSDFYLEPSALLDVSGRGTMKGSWNHNVKASNGQVGGPTYGSLYEPVHGGSQGGQSSTGVPGPRGGGVSRIKVGGVLLLDGILDATGLSGINGAGGGHFRGHGVMSSSGGQGSGGGGAGGRIAVHIEDKDEFRGDLLALGGSGTSETMEEQELCTWRK